MRVSQKIVLTEYPTAIPNKNHIRMIEENISSRSTDDVLISETELPKQQAMQKLRHGSLIRFLR